MKKPTKRKRTSLPRVTIMAYSRNELERFSLACEQLVGLSHMMVGLMTRLDAVVTKLEKRSEASRKAHRTMKEQQENHEENPGAGGPTAG